MPRAEDKGAANLVASCVMYMLRDYSQAFIKQVLVKLSHAKPREFRPTLDP